MFMRRSILPWLPVGFRAAARLLQRNWNEIVRTSHPDAKHRVFSDGMHNLGAMEADILELSIA
jgi:hypothetical protein